MQRCITVTKLQVILYGTSATVLFVFPFVMFFVFGKKQLLFKMNLPYLDFDFWTFLLFEIFFSAMGSFGTFVVDFIFIITAFNAAAYISLVTLDLHHIKETILKQERTGKKNNADITNLIRSSLIRHNVMKG